MSVKRWATSCADEVRRLLKDIESNNPQEFKQVSDRLAITFATIYFEATGCTPANALESSHSRVSSKSNTPWATTCTDWYVVVRATPEVLAEVVKQLKGLDLMQHNETTLWVISKKMPPSERRLLTK